MTIADPPSRLLLDADALVSNWRWLAARSHGAACGAAVKADGYGLGAREVVARLAAAGCRDFFVATWAEALALGRMPDGAALSVFHGVRTGDMAAARAGLARPVLNTTEQVRRWADAGGGPCDVMVDTGMNRLGLSVEEAASGLLDGLMIETLMSHLACADEPGHDLNRRQLEAFLAVKALVRARRYSLANSAGIVLGRDYAFDLTRPGLSLYGGIQCAEMVGHIRQVAHPEVEILQVRAVGPGDAIGYNATFAADRPMRIGVINLGYADGYLRSFSPNGRALAADGAALPVIGRISMDLVAIDLSAAPDLGEGGRVRIDFRLPEAGRQSGLSQYELLTGLGRRYQRQWF